MTAAGVDGSRMDSECCEVELLEGPIPPPGSQSLPALRSNQTIGTQIASCYRRLSIRERISFRGAKGDTYFRAAPKRPRHARRGQQADRFFVGSPEQGVN